MPPSPPPAIELRSIDKSFGAVAANRDVSLAIAPGSFTGIVGENGAGKTTLVKLLAKMYEPSSGTIAIDGTPLSRIPADGWRQRLAGAFQDFFRFEFHARHSIGLGDLPRMDDEAAGMRAVNRAGANDVIESVRPATRLGPSLAGRRELSFGQWRSWR